MIAHLIQLVILFFVIFDPPASFAVFFSASSSLSRKERNKLALLSLLVAFGISLLFLILGENILHLFNTNIFEFKVAGGIILGILGIKMTLGYPLVNMEKMKKQSGYAVASIIGTPLLTGPAAITAIIISVNDFGRIITLLAVSIVILVTALLFYFGEFLHKIIGTITVQVISTMLGLITLSWGINFILSGAISILRTL